MPPDLAPLPVEGQGIEGLSVEKMLFGFPPMSATFPQPLTRRLLDRRTIDQTCKAT